MSRDPIYDPSTEAFAESQRLINEAVFASQDELARLNRLAQEAPTEGEK